MDKAPKGIEDQHGGDGEQPARTALARPSATFIGLHRWTGDRAIGAVNATVAVLVFEPLTTTLAIVEELANVGGHLLSRLLSALWACDG